MIHEVDEGLRLLFAENGLQEGGVELVFDAPTKEWSARRNAPTISVFLYGIREDASRRQAGAAEEHGADGTITAWRTPPRWFELAYLVTAWTNRPQDEHRLLSQALSCLVGADVLPPRHLTGTLAELGLTVGLDTSGGSEGMPSVSDVWTGLGGELKPSIDLRVRAPLAGERAPAGPAVTEGLVVRVSDRSTAPPDSGDDDADGPVNAAGRGGAPDPGRRLRYDSGAGAGTGTGTGTDSGADTGTGTGTGAEGFAAPRRRPLPPGRRRRGGSAR